MNRFRFSVFALSLTAAAGCTVTTTTPPPPDNSIPTSCAVDSTVTGCSGSSTGYSCTSTDTPDESDPTLECSIGVQGNANSTLFCCLTGETFTASTCAPDPTVASCQGGSYGFSCTGADTPEQTDANLICSTGVQGNASSTLFCCTGG